jgi:hypothetical protein
MNKTDNLYLLIQLAVKAPVERIQLREFVQIHEELNNRIPLLATLAENALRTVVMDMQGFCMPSAR